MATACVIGAGIVGLHVAHALLEKGFEVYVLDKEKFLGEHTSGRNSGVIHAGIFYEAGSLKEQTCIEGNRLTYEWVKRLNVPHHPCGKWIVPHSGREDDLDSFFDKVSALPIPKPSIKTAEEVALEEPLLRRTAAIFIPSTGILDAASYINHLRVYLENLKATVITECEMTGFHNGRLSTSKGEMECDVVVNSAGLFCDEMASMAGLEGYSIRPCRGDYYVAAKSPVSRPVYHLPEEGAHGLGVHLTPTVDGELLVGPNAYFIEGKNDYEHASDINEYRESLAFYLPSMAGAKLRKGYSGNRPKLFFQGKPLAELTIIRKGSWIHLLGIESPGLTAAPALARHVAGMV